MAKTDADWRAFLTEADDKKKLWEVQEQKAKVAFEYQELPASLALSIQQVINAANPCILIWGEEMYYFYNKALLSGLSNAFIQPWVSGTAFKYSFPQVFQELSQYLNKNLNPSPEIRLVFQDWFTEQGFSLSCFPIYDGGPTTKGWLLQFWPDHESSSVFSLQNSVKQAEKLLLQQDQLFDTLNEGIFSKDIAHNKYLRLTRACCNIYGYEQEDFLNNPNLWAEVIHPDDIIMVLQDDLAHLAGRQTITQYRIFQKNGELRWIEIKAIPYLENNKLIRVDGIVNDITERKKAEQEREKITAELLEKIINLKQFSYIVSHNLRSPINKIMGLANLVLDLKTSEEEKRSLLHHIVNETSNLDSVVKDLTTIIAYQDAGGNAKELVNFQTELDLVLSALEIELKESEAHIVSDFSEIASINSLKGYIYSIIFNLVSNAIKYRRPGVRPEISITTKSNGHNVAIEVKDNGLGIDLNRHRHEIFILYNRFHHENIPGKGIGLNLVKTQAEALGGRVEVESEPGRGTCFRVILPLYQQ